MVKKTIYFDVMLKSSDRINLNDFKARQKVMTNDKNSVDIVFRATDVEPNDLKGATASIFLYMQDGSFFQSNSVVITNNVLTYTMTQNQTQHKGTTKVQIVVKSGTIDNASLLQEFEISPGLEKYPLTEVMIQDWTTLTAEAKAFVDQIEGFTLESFVENKMDEELANLEVNYAGRLTGLEAADQNLTAQLAQIKPNAENANIQVEMAKGSFQTLKDRLDAGDANVTNGLTNLNNSLKNFDVNWINKNLGKLDGTFFSDEFMIALHNGEVDFTLLADGSVTTPKMASGAATRDKLGDKFIGNGVINSGGINIDTYLKHGATILTAPISGTLPSDFNRFDAGLLINLGSDPICFQMLFTYNKLYTEVWTRFAYTNGNLGTWERGFGNLSVGNKSIKRANLTDNFRDGGTFSGDINTLTKEGSYLVFPPYSGTIPDGFTASTAFVIDVSVTGISWVKHTIRPLYGETKQFSRTFRATSPITNLTEWKEIAYNLKKPRKMLFLGDSIPDGSDYPTLMGTKTGIAITNGAIGGTTLSTHAQAAYDPFGGANLITAIVTGDWATQDANAGTVSAGKVNLLKQVDLAEYTDVVFAYGTNDAYSITQLGDEDDTSIDTWSGAINHTLQTLMTAQPHLQVSLISPIFRARYIAGDGKNSDDFERPIGGYLIDFVEVEMRQGKKYHAPVLDLYNNSGINKFTSEYFLSDGLHLSDKGKERLANVVGSFLISKY